MRNPFPEEVEKGRIRLGEMGSPAGWHEGCFIVRHWYGHKQHPGLRGTDLSVTASAGGGWDHVSVSLKNRTPTWREMEFVRGLFFDDEEWALQYSAPRAKHINIHPHCLHLWRPQNQELPVPPEWMV